MAGEEVTQPRPAITDLAYGESAALRYNEFEGRSSGFARSAAPRIATFHTDRSIADINPAVLDIGCGTGQLASYLLDRGIPVTGIDPSPYMIHHALRNNAVHVSTGRARFLIMDGAELNLRDTYGLAVATFNTLNHLPSQERLRDCLASVHNATVPGGCFLFDIDTRRGLEQTADIAVLSETHDETTLRIRRWEADRLLLYATGWFRSGSYRWRYRETIKKIIIDTELLRRTIFSVGWSELTYTTEDYSTPVENAEVGARAYGVAWKD